MIDLPNQFWSDVFGYFGLACWFIVMSPQIYINWKLKNASSLAPAYVLICMIGNLISCIGAVLSGLIITTILVTGYLSILGSIMLYQIYLYQPNPNDVIVWRPKPDSEHGDNVSDRRVSILSRLSIVQEYEPVVLNHDPNLPSNVLNHEPNLPSNALPNIDEDSPLLDHNIRESNLSIRSIGGRSSVRSHHFNQRHSGLNFDIASDRPSSIISKLSKRLSVVSTYSYLPTATPPTQHAQSLVFYPLIIVSVLLLILFYFIMPSPAELIRLKVPQVLGWTSTLLFFIGRIPQAYKNYQRKSVEGLSLTMFFLSILGNTCYLLAIISYSLKREYILMNLPWIIGGTLGLLMDAVVLSQFFIYKDNFIPIYEDDVE